MLGRNQWLFIKAADGTVAAGLRVGCAQILAVEIPKPKNETHTDLDNFIIYRSGFY